MGKRYRRALHRVHAGDDELDFALLIAECL